MAKKSANGEMEKEMKTMQRHMGGLVKTVLDLKSKIEELENKTVLDLKSKIEELENKIAEKDKDEIESIREKQIIIVKAIAANSAAISKIDKEIQTAAKVVVKTVTNDANEDQNEVVKPKKCRYNNCGFCKYKTKCRYTHSKHICMSHALNQKCETKDCDDRHPAVCKWSNKKGGCKRNSECDYLHVKLSSEAERNQSYECISCKCVWTDKTCVKEHFVQNMKKFFCLNCDDWVKNKGNVLQPGWTLLDEAGYLRMDV